MSFQINVSWDPSVASAPVGFQGAVNAAVSQLESLFTNNITININVGWGEVGQQEPNSPTDGNGNPTGNPIATYAIAQNNTGTYYPFYTYDQIKAALLGIQNPSADQQAAYAALPANDPLNSGAPFTLTYANALALGLPVSPTTSIADDVGFATGANLPTGTSWYFGTGVRQPANSA
jgi:hypothetical protein